MANPLSLYGDSYGDLSRLDLQHDAARDSRYFQLLADARNQEQAQRRAQEHADAVALQMQQMGLGVQENNANRALQFQTHQDTTDYQNRALAQNANLFQNQLQQGLKIAQMGLDATNNRNRETDADKVYNEAYSAIHAGAIQTPDELQAFVGSKVPAQEADRLVAWLQREFDQRKGAFEQGNRAAQTLNEEMTRRLAPMQPGYDKAQLALKKAIPETHWYNPATWGKTSVIEAANAAPITLYNQERDKFMEEVNKAKPYANVVSYDPNSKGFISLIPAPKSFGTNTLQSAPVVPPHPLLDPAARAAAASSGAALDSWVPVPAAGVKVHPGVWNVIKQTAATIPNPADKAAYLHQAIQKAVVDKNALPFAPAPRVAPGKGFGSLEDIPWEGPPNGWGGVKKLLW